VPAAQGRDRTQPQPRSFREDKIASLDTPICLFSASKAVTAVLVHLLAQQGKVNLLYPVSYYLPAFAANGKGSITLWQLLTHRSGIAKLPPGTDVNLLFDHDAATAMICAAASTDCRRPLPGLPHADLGFYIQRTDQGNDRPGRAAVSAALHQQTDGHALFQLRVE
jgi:CubicO group peptidase (beta-lactamase class C family)